jgi:hypothetical protein
MLQAVKVEKGDYNDLAFQTAPNASLHFPLFCHWEFTYRSLGINCMAKFAS